VSIRKWRAILVHIAAGVLIPGALVVISKREADRFFERIAAELRSAGIRSAGIQAAPPDRSFEELDRSTEALERKIDSLRAALLRAASVRAETPVSSTDSNDTFGVAVAPDDVPDPDRASVRGGDPDRRRLLADAKRLAAAGDTLQAERTLETLLLRFPADPEGSIALGELLAAEYGEDPASLRRAAELAVSAGRDAGCAAASHALLAAIARDCGDAGTAEYHFRMAVSLAPGKREYSRQLGIMLYDEGKWADALGQFELVAAAGGGGDPDMRYCRAMARANLGDRRRAAAELDALFADEPSLYGAAEAAGSIFSLLGEHERAAELLSAAAAIRRTWRLMQQLGREELAAGRSGAAASSFTTAIHLFADDPSSTTRQRDELLRDLARAKDTNDRSSSIDVDGPH